MKNISLLYFFLLPFLVCSQNYSAPQNLPNYDRKPIHFGFLIGLNNLDFEIKQNPNQSESIFVLKSQNQKGFNMGVVTNFRLNNNFDLRVIPTLSLAERQISYIIEDNAIPENFSRKIESTFIEFPIAFKYKSERYNNGRAYVLTGVKYSLDLASLRNINDEGLELVKLKQNDLSYEIGLGIDFYLSYFKFATEIKGTFGLLNLLKEDDSIYSNSIESLHSRGFTITFTFE
tara:strand:+ start:19 stop:711 length:693 start_codon:yes stop_codon:yes gene_type:complete